MTAIDDTRVVLPLAKARYVAVTYCRENCGGIETGVHKPLCLVPHLNERDRMLISPDLDEVVMPDCRDGKCVACTGCAHSCHRHHNRA